MEKKDQAHELYQAWRKIIDKLACMDSSDVRECASLRNEAMEIGNQFKRKTGKNIVFYTS